MGLDPNNHWQFKVGTLIYLQFLASVDATLTSLAVGNLVIEGKICKGWSVARTLKLTQGVHEHLMQSDAQYAAKYAAATTVTTGASTSSNVETLALVAAASTTSDALTLIASQENLEDTAEGGSGGTPGGTAGGASGVSPGGASRLEGPLFTPAESQSSGARSGGSKRKAGADSLGSSVSRNTPRSTRG
jgi:Tfp pilus assembly major pilin PilA